MNIHFLYGLARRFRAKRFQHFCAQTKISATDLILDIGGYYWNWTAHPPMGKAVRIINLDSRHTYDKAQHPQHNLDIAVADGCALPYIDKSYDVVYSNSVIEHVGNYEKQRAFANECRRVGKRLWIQTPAYEFFIEPHFLAPFIHWTPRNLRLKLVRFFTVWGWVEKPSPDRIRETVDEIRLLRYHEMKELFPGCQILRERFLGVFTKSYIAFR